MIKYCHQRANEVRESVHRRDETHNIKVFSNYPMKQNRQVLLALVNEIIRMLDMIEEEKRYLSEKFLTNEDLIDQQARMNLPKIKLTSASIKCWYRMNQY